MGVTKRTRGKERVEQEWNNKSNKRSGAGRGKGAKQVEQEESSNKRSKASRIRGVEQ
jgi:hypothetical protein